MSSGKAMIIPLTVAWIKMILYKCNYIKRVNILLNHVNVLVDT